MKLFALLAAAAAVLCAQAPLQLPVNMDLPADTVVATSDGKPITAGEIRNILAAGDPQAIGMAKNNPDQFLGALFFNRYLATEAERQHLAEQSPLKEQLQFLLNRFLAFAATQQIRESYNVPEEAINDFYAHNQSRFETAWIKVIAIGFCPVATATGTSIEDIKRAAEEAVAISGCKNKHTEQQARDIAVGLVGIIRGGKDFVKMVAQYSEDPDSKATEGDFGLVTRENSFKQEIKDATFALGKDDISDPIRSGNFFYIIKIKERTVRPISEVHEQIIQELKQKHFTDLMYDLQKRFKPEIVRPDFFTAKQ
jgi:parvulin-like peptidyl-prolyl isomerase